MYNFGGDFEIFLSTDDFAHTATIGMVANVRTIFDKESEVFSSDGSTVRGYAPTLLVYEGDLGYNVLDELVSNITDTYDNSVWPIEYRIIDIVNDGTGELTLILREEP